MLLNHELIAQCGDDSVGRGNSFPGKAARANAKPEGFYAVICYSPREMAQDQPVKALVIALTGYAAAAVYSINRLQPDSLCFVLPEGAKALVESDVQPKIEHMPKRWDWVVLTETGDFGGCYQTIARTLPEMLRTWDVQPGELVVDVTGATPAMAGALTLATLSLSPPRVSLVGARGGCESGGCERGTSVSQLPDRVAGGGAGGARGGEGRYCRTAVHMGAGEPLG